MQPEDVTKAANAGIKWVNEQMGPADLVAVASIGSSLQILSDFTSDKEHVHSVLQAFSAADGTAFTAVDASTSATDEATAGQTDDCLPRERSSLHRVRHAGQALRELQRGEVLSVGVGLPEEAASHAGRMVPRSRMAR